METATFTRPDLGLVFNHWTEHGAVNLGNIWRNMALLGMMFCLYSSCIQLVMTNFIKEMLWGREWMNRKMRGVIGEYMVLAFNLYSSIHGFNPIVISLNRNFYS